MARQRLKKKMIAMSKLKNVVERLLQLKGLSISTTKIQHGRDCVPEDVKEGHFVVLAVDGCHEQRFVVPLMFLDHPMFRKLLEQAEEEFGFDHEGALMVPCTPTHLRMLLDHHFSS